MVVLTLKSSFKTFIYTSLFSIDIKTHSNHLLRSNRWEIIHLRVCEIVPLIRHSGSRDEPCANLTRRAEERGNTHTCTLVLKPLLLIHAISCRDDFDGGKSKNRKEIQLVHSSYASRTVQWARRFTTIGSNKSCKGVTHLKRFKKQVAPWRSLSIHKEENLQRAPKASYTSGQRIRTRLGGRAYSLIKRRGSLL